MTKINTMNIPSSNLKYYFIAAAIATAIAGIVHLYMPLLAHPQMLNNTPIATFFLGSGIAQLFWVIPMIRRWGKIWYYIGIAGNVAFILLYVITRFPGNPINGRGGDADIIDLTCEFAQLAFIIITSIIIVKENKLKSLVKGKMTQD
ncbi:MAG TPA: hypothetical protein VGC75_00150 [Candidatus Nitrosocosmicus sp.]